MKNNIKTSLEYNYYSLCYHFNKRDWEIGCDEHIIKYYHTYSVENAVKWYLEDWKTVNNYYKFWEGETQTGWVVEYKFDGKAVKAYIRTFKGNSVVNLNKLIRFNGFESIYLENCGEFNKEEYEKKLKN